MSSFKKIVVCVMLFVSSNTPAEVWVENTSGCELGVLPRNTPSTKCLSCHDGSVAHAIAISHPIGKTLTAQMKNPPEQVVLHNGTVTCSSCHDGSSTFKNKTAMSMNKSQMCFACHNM